MTALRGIRVLELAENVAGEYCGKLLADFGAEVIKVEKPGAGSPTRHLGPFRGGEAGPERSGLFAYLNTNKRSATLDVSNEAGKKTLAALIERVDVVIDDHAIDWLRGVGLDPQSVARKYPGLVLCSITAYGLDPADERRHAEDLTVYHASGWGYHTPSGETERPPLKGAGRFLPSYEAGLEAALCINAALYEREESRQGQCIEISKQEVLASRVDYVLGQMIAGDMDVSDSRTAFDLSGPAGIFPCRDGFAYIWMSAPSHWEGLRQLLDDAAWMDEDFPEHWMERGCTPERVARCRHHIGEWLKTQNKHEAAEKAQKLGVTLVAVNNAKDLLESPQFQFRGYFAQLDHPVLGTVNYPTVPYRMSATPAQLRTPAPPLGEFDLSLAMDEEMGQ